MKQVYEVTKILAVLILLTVGVAVVSGENPDDPIAPLPPSGGGGATTTTPSDGDMASLPGSGSADACDNGSGSGWYAPNGSAPSGNSNPPITVSGASQSKDCDIETRDQVARRSLISNGDLFVFEDVFLGEGSKQVVFGFGANPFSRLKLNGQLNVNGPGYVEDHLTVGVADNLLQEYGTYDDQLHVQGDTKITGEITSGVLSNTYNNLTDASLCAGIDGKIVLCNPTSAVASSILVVNEPAPSNSNACDYDYKTYTANVVGTASAYQWSVCEIDGSSGFGNCPAYVGGYSQAGTWTNKGTSNSYTAGWVYGDPSTVYASGVTNPSYVVRLDVSDNSTTPPTSSVSYYTQAVSNTPPAKYENSSGNLVNCP
jgi:hypothetical protein